MRELNHPLLPVVRPLSSNLIKMGKSLKNIVLTTLVFGIKNTYIMLPDNFVSRRVGSNDTFKVHVISFFDVVWVQFGTQL